MTFRYTYISNPLHPKVKITVGPHSADFRISPHPIFSQLKQLHLLEDQLNILVVTMIKNGEVLILPEKAEVFSKRCQQSFGILANLDLTQLGVGLILGSNEQDIGTLDNLKIENVLSVIASAFNNTGSKLHSKLLRKLKNYIRITKRATHQKQILEAMAKVYKQNINIQQKEQDAPKLNEVQKQIKINKKTQSLAENEEESEGDKIKQTDQIKTNKQRSNKAQKGFNTSSDQKELQQIYTRAAKNKNKGEEQKDESLAKQSDKFLATDKRNKVQKRNNRGKPAYSYSKENDRKGGSFSKQKFDNRVLLGINGDTQNGWRQRNRPSRVPPKVNLDDGQQNFPPKQSKQKIVRASEQQSWEQDKQELKLGNKKQLPLKNNQKQKNQTAKQCIEAKQANPKGNEVIAPKIDQIIKTSHGDMKLIYTFPKDGNLFKFGKLKDNFMIQINGNFWIQYHKNDLQITKGDHGYLRNSAIDIIDHGFMAEGLTINLDGNSNLEDGGETAGSPKIQEFTGNSSQFFHILTLQAYVPV